MKKKLFLDNYNDPALMTVTRKSVKVSFHYYQYVQGDIEAIEKALEKALNESGLFCVDEWTENRKGSVK